MRNNQKLISLLLASAGAMIFVAPAVAQDVSSAAVSATSQNESSDSIVVTARRFEERLQDVPISITVFSPDKLSKLNIYNASDLAEYTPSLSTNNRYGPEKSAFAIRGFTQDAGTAPSVAVYFADVTAPRAQGGTPSGNGAGVGAFFDLANVQVLKGPQGTLFGRNTTGGAILLVPQKPTDKLEGYVEGTIGNHNARRIQGVLNLPVTDDFRLRMGVDRNTRDGYLINHSGIGPRDFDDTDYTALRLSALATITPNIENYTIGSFSSSNTHGPALRLVGCNQASTSPLAAAGCSQIARQAARGDSLWDVESDNRNPYSHLKQWGVINTTTWQANDSLKIKNIASYQRFQETTSINISGDNFTVPVGFGPLAGQPLPLIISRNGDGAHQVDQSTLTEELQLQGQALDSRLTWQAGGYFESSKPVSPGIGFTQVLLDCTDVFAYQCASPFGATAGSISAPLTSTSFRDIGIYAQGTYKISSKLSVTGGVRYTDDNADQNAQIVTVRFNSGANTPRFFCSNLLRFPGTPLPGQPAGLGKEISSLDSRDQCSVNLHEHSARPTWLIDLDYKPIDDVLLYAKYARGYRQGGVNANAVGFETWQPEKVDAYEIGLKASFSGKISGYFNIAAFYNKFSDQQLQANALAKPTSGIPGVNIIVNAGRSTIKGVEVDASISPIAGLKFDAGYAYLDTRLDSLNVPTLDPNSPYSSVVPTATAGSSLSYSPKNRYTLTASYTLPLDENIGKITFGATFTHTDSQISSLATLPQFGILPATNLLNLNAGWNSVFGKPFDLSLFATNVTNRAFPLAVSSSYNSFGFESVVPNEPRMFGVRLRVRFTQ